MTIYPDCQTCKGTGKVIVPEGRTKVQIGFFDCTKDSDCPHCDFKTRQDAENARGIVVSDSDLETRVARIERHLGLSIEDDDRREWLTRRVIAVLGDLGIKRTEITQTMLAAMVMFVEDVRRIR